MSTRHKIGHVSETGAVLIAEGTYIPKWVIEGAPYIVAPSVVNAGSWLVIGRHGGIYGYFVSTMDKEAAQQHADQLNTDAATAVMVRGL